MKRGLSALVTGANGLVGSNIVRALTRRGYHVRALVRNSADIRSLHGVPCDLAYGDIQSASDVESAAAGCRFVFHTAAQFQYDEPFESLQETAVTGTRTVIQAASRARVDRIVLTSSSVVFGSGTCCLPRNESSRFDGSVEPGYCRAKAAQHAVAFDTARREAIDLIAVCPTLCVGPHDYRLGPSNRIITDYLSDPTRSTFIGGCNIQSVRDAAEGHILLAEAGGAVGSYLLGADNLEWSLAHRIIGELCGIAPPRLYANRTASYLSVYAGEWLAKACAKKPAVTREQASMVGRFYWYSHERAFELGYRPMTTRQALAEAISWLMMSEHTSRALRSTILLSDEVHRVRRTFRDSDLYVGRPQ